MNLSDPIYDLMLRCLHRISDCDHRGNADSLLETVGPLAGGREGEVRLHWDCLGVSGLMQISISDTGNVAQHLADKPTVDTHHNAKVCQIIYV